MEKCVYLLQHVNDSGGIENAKVIGIFESEKNAENAINFLKDKPGFCASIKGFYIDRYELNKVWWQDGYGFE
jgi:hypothetical protein